MRHLTLVYPAPVLPDSHSAYWSLASVWWAYAAIIPAVWLSCWRYPR